MDEGISRETAKRWWLRCVACSEASVTTQNRGFGFDAPAYEQAMHAFSGGFMHLLLAHWCGTGSWICRWCRTLMYSWFGFGFNSAQAGIN